jgi:hypothetical protein
VLNVLRTSFRVSILLSICHKLNDSTADAGNFFNLILFVPLQFARGLLMGGNGKLMLMSAILMKQFNNMKWNGYFECCKVNLYVEICLH